MFLMIPLDTFLQGIPFVTLWFQRPDTSCLYKYRVDDAIGMYPSDHVLQDKTGNCYRSYRIHRIPMIVGCFEMHRVNRQSNFCTSFDQLSLRSIS